MDGAQACPRALLRAGRLLQGQAEQRHKDGVLQVQKFFLSIFSPTIIPFRRY